MSVFKSFSVPSAFIRNDLLKEKPTCAFDSGFRSDLEAFPTNQLICKVAHSAIDNNISPKSNLPSA